MKRWRKYGETYVEEAVESSAEEEDVLRVLDGECPRIALTDLRGIVCRDGDER